MATKAAIHSEREIGCFDPCTPINRKTKELVTNAAYSQNDSTATLPFSVRKPTGPMFPRMMPAVNVASTPEDWSARRGEKSRRLQWW